MPQENVFNLSGLNLTQVNTMLATLQTQLTAVQTALLAAKAAHVTLGQTMTTARAAYNAAVVAWENASFQTLTDQEEALRARITAIQGYATSLTKI